MNRRYWHGIIIGAPPSCVAALIAKKSSSSSVGDELCTYVLQRTLPLLGGGVCSSVSLSLYEVRQTSSVMNSTDCVSVAASVDRSQSRSQEVQRVIVVI